MEDEQNQGDGPRVTLYIDGMRPRAPEVLVRVEATARELGDGWIRVRDSDRDTLQRRRLPGCRRARGRRDVPLVCAALEEQTCYVCKLAYFVAVLHRYGVPLAIYPAQRPS